MTLTPIIPGIPRTTRPIRASDTFSSRESGRPSRCMQGAALFFTPRAREAYTGGRVPAGPLGVRQQRIKRDSPATDAAGRHDPPSGRSSNGKPRGSSLRAPRPSRRSPGRTPVCKTGDAGSIPARPFSYSPGGRHMGWPVKPSYSANGSRGPNPPLRRRVFRDLLDRLPATRFRTGWPPVRRSADALLARRAGAFSFTRGVTIRLRGGIGRRRG